MIIENSRRKLDQALQNHRTTILVLSGTEDSEAGDVHEFIEGYEWDPWYRWFLITRLEILQPGERRAWFEGANTEQYAVLGGRSPKQVAVRGPIEDLLRASDGKPSILAIEVADRAIEDSLEERAVTLRLEAFLQQSGKDPIAIHLDGYDSLGRGELVLVTPESSSELRPACVDRYRARINSFELCAAHNSKELMRAR